MGIAMTLREYLDDKHVDYDVMVHKRTQCAQDSARASHVPAERLAKAVVLTREGGFVLAVVPASSRVKLDTIEKMLHCHVEVASEEEISELFPDCETGAVFKRTAVFVFTLVKIRTGKLCYKIAVGSVYHHHFHASFFTDPCAIGILFHGFPDFFFSHLSCWYGISAQPFGTQFLGYCNE